MPNDLYRWEGTGSLVHHCPQCFKPLTVPQARTRCLGEHVEWCKGYHTQLFKKGTCGTCDPCRRSDEEHVKRHREIAGLILELRQIKHVDDRPLSPLIPRAGNILLLPVESLPADETPKRKKERKAIKRAKKISDMPKVISSADVERVAEVLHPPLPHDGNDDDETDMERQLLEDPEINLNRFFHKGTSNRRELRLALVKRDKHNHSDDNDLHVDSAHLEGLLQLLDVPPLTLTSSSEERNVHDKLKRCIEKDLLHTRQETEMMMMRKAGFWRWASKKAYNRLVQNGRIWGQKDYDISSSSTKVSDDLSASSVLDRGKENEGIDVWSEADTDAATLSDEAPMDAMSLLSIDARAIPDTPVTSNCTSDDEEWTTVRRLKKATPPFSKSKLTLVSNHGLDQFSPSAKKQKQKPAWRR